MATNRDSIDATVMAIREQLIGYFKNGCIRNVITHSNIVPSSDDNPGGRRYQRHTAQLKNKMTYYFRHGGDYHPFCSTERQPDLITLHLGVLDRSVTMRAIRDGIEECLHKYLRGVHVATDNMGEKSKWRVDKSIADSNLDDLREAAKRNPQQYTEVWDNGTLSQRIITSNPIQDAVFNGPRVTTNSADAFSGLSEDSLRRVYESITSVDVGNLPF